MIVVSDSTPIISLAKMSKLDILEKLFSEVLIPEAVFNEVTSNYQYIEEANYIKSCSFIKTVTVADKKLVVFLKRATGLDLGESEAIVYMEEYNGDLLLVDEARARRVAESMDIKIMGTVGMLVTAFKEGYLSDLDIMECIKVIRASHRNISESLINILMEMIKE